MSFDPITPESLYQKLLQSQEKLPSENLYLSTIEWKNINFILNHNDSTPELRNKVKNIIYNCYEEWAFSMVHLIKNNHWEKCGQIQIDELKLYAYIGLRKALINYDSTKYNQFTNYAVKYVYSEIFSGIYELTPIYASDENYKYRNKHKVINRMHIKKRNVIRRQKYRSNFINNQNDILGKNDYDYKK